MAFAGGVEVHTSRTIHRLMREIASWKAAQEPAVLALASAIHGPQASLSHEHGKARKAADTEAADLVENEPSRKTAEDSSED